MSDVAALLQEISSRLANIEQKIGIASASVDANERNPLAVDFENTIIKGHLPKLLEAFNKLGDDGAKIASIFKTQFDFVLEVIDMANKVQKPNDQEKAALYERIMPTVKEMSDLSHPRTGVKDADLSTAIRGFELAASLFSWPLEGGHEIANQGMDSSGTYVFRASRAAKDNNKQDLLDALLVYNKVVRAMVDWVKDNAKMGITWNPKGVPASQYSGASGSAAESSVPPPAATPTPTATPTVTPTTGGGGPDVSALFSEIGSIDQSSGRTAGLRHVTKDMKAGSGSSPAVVPAVTKASTPASKNTGVPGLKMGEPKIECVAGGKRWEATYLTKATNPEPIVKIPDAGMQHEVYIFGCRDVAIDIPNKVKGMRIDNCYNVTILLTSALSGVEIVNSKRMKIQCRDNLPSVAIDKTDGIVVGLPWSARNTVVTTSKSSEMNVTFPVSEAEDADWIELPIPEQFVTSINDKNKLDTKVSELYI